MKLGFAGLFLCASTMVNAALFRVGNLVTIETPSPIHVGGTNLFPKGSPQEAYCLSVDKENQYYTSPEFRSKCYTEYTRNHMIQYLGVRVEIPLRGDTIAWDKFNSKETSQEESSQDQEEPLVKVALENTQTA